MADTIDPIDPIAPSRGWRVDGRRSAGLLFAVVVATYAAGAQAAWSVFGADEAGVAFFPPAGITVAALVLVRRRWWPVVLAAAFVAETLVDLAHGVRLAPAIGFATANTLEPLVGASLLALAVARSGTALDLRRRADFGRFLACAGAGGPVVGALVGATVVSLEAGTPWLPGVAHWWAGDGLAVVVLGTTVVLLATAPPPRTRRWELIAVLVAAIASSITAFYLLDVPPAAFVLPLMVWSGFRLELFGVALVGTVYGAVSSAATAAGEGPFAAIPGISDGTRLGIAQVMTAVVVITGWMFAIEVRERLRAVAEREVAQLDRYRFEVMVAAGEASARMAAASTTEEILAALRASVCPRLGADDVALVPTGAAQAGTGLHDLPVTAGDSGITMVVRRSYGHPIDDVDRDYLAAVAAVVALALERVRLHELRVAAAGDAESARTAFEREAERLALAVEAATILVYDVDLDTRTVSTSGRTELLGIDHDGGTVATVEAWRQRIHPDDAEQHLRTWNADHATGRARTVSYRIRHHDGSWRVVEDNRRFVGGPGGSRVIGALRDITAERADQRRTAALANLSDALAVAAPGSVELEPVLDAIAVSAVPGFARRCCVHVVDGATATCRARAVAGPTDATPWCPAGASRDWLHDTSPVSTVIRSGMPVVGDRSLCVPVIIDGVVRGVIEFDLGPGSTESFTPADATLATEFARRCSAIIQELMLRRAAEEAEAQARVAEGEQRAARRRAERLQRASATVSAAAGVTDVLAAIESVAPDVAEVRRSIVVRVPHDSSAMPALGSLAPIVEEAISRREAIVRSSPAPAAAVPLRAGTADVAAVVAFDLLGDVDEQLQPFLTELGRQWSESLGRAFAYDLERIAVARVTALQSVTAALGAAATMDEIRSAVALAGPLLGATSIELGDGDGDGGFTLVARHADGEVARDDTGLFATVRDLVAQSCTRVALSDLEHTTAVQLQQAMLGAPDAVPRLDTAAAYRAAQAGLEIGGDWYDVVDLGERGAACIVGDVVGHSLTAATAMGQLRSAGRALAPLATDPADLISRIEGFAAAVKEARYTTLAVVFVDVERGTLRYACAGHLPPLLVRSDGTAEYLMGARGMPLAGAVGVTRTWAEVPLHPGDLLVLYTDGLVERRDEPIDAGLDRLVLAVTDLRQLDTDRFCAGVVDALLDGRDQTDDVALLVARPVATRFERTITADPAELAPMRITLRRWLFTLGLGADDVADVLIAVGEGTANAVEHAYIGSEPGVVQVSVELTDGALRTTIHDEGSWRSEPAPGNRGRGTAIMRAIADRVDVRATATGTTVTIDHRVGTVRRSDHHRSAP